MNTEQPLQEVDIALTEYAHGAGCGCKIAPSVLQEILKSHISVPDNDKLLVGNHSNDDAAVYLLNDQLALISTTDFFTPIVDDAFLFGKIAAANAISDVYAMGGAPIIAIAILGWPVETLPAALAQRVIAGAREICAEANIPLAGGHSIDSKEPIFGLAVNGLLHPSELKKNNTAQQGDYLFLTKPIGTGILSTAQKRKQLQPEDYDEWIAQLTKLNSLGAQLGKLPGVTSMTDTTGFGLLGHLIEMATGSDLSAELYYSKVPILEAAKGYAAQRIIPDATYRNWNAYSQQVRFEAGVNVMEAFNLLPDPQTNGGLLFSVEENAIKEVEAILLQNGYDNFITPVGRMIEQEEKTIVVK
jgi:selenide, water dikinase